MKHVKTDRERFAIFHQLLVIKFSLTVVIGDVVAHDLDLHFEGQRFESEICLTFMRDYHANDDRYDTNYYGH